MEIADSSWDAVQQGMMLVADDTTSLNALSDLGLDVAERRVQPSRAEAIRTMRCSWVMRRQIILRLRWQCVSPMDILLPIRQKWPLIYLSITLILWMMKKS